MHPLAASVRPRRKGAPQPIAEPAQPKPLLEAAGSALGEGFKLMRKLSKAISSKAATSLVDLPFNGTTNGAHGGGAPDGAYRGAPHARAPQIPRGPIEGGERGRPNGAGERPGVRCGGAPLANEHRFEALWVRHVSRSCHADLEGRQGQQRG